MTTQIVNGLTVELDGPAIGHAEALLCIHGLGGSSNTWTPVMAAFEGFTIMRPDLPGSARSNLPDEKLSIEVYVDAIDRLLIKLGVDAVHVVAHSLGTIVAQHFAVRFPEKVKSLALFGPLVAPPDAARLNITARAALARNGVSAMQEIADVIVNGATSKETKADQPAVLALVRESVMRQSSEGYAQSCEALAAAQPASIEAIHVPVLLVTGDQDGVAPVANVTPMNQRIGGSRMALFDGCGHWTTYEKPQACMQELQHFYASIR